MDVRQQELIDAIKCDNFNRTEILLRQGADSNFILTMTTGAINKYTKLPLIFLARSFEILALMLDYQANPNVKMVSMHIRGHVEHPVHLLDYLLTLEHFDLSIIKSVLSYYSDKFDDANINSGLIRLVENRALNKKWSAAEESTALAFMNASKNLFVKVFSRFSGKTSPANYVIQNRHFDILELMLINNVNLLWDLNFNPLTYTYSSAKAGVENLLNTNLFSRYLKSMLVWQMLFLGNKSDSSNFYALPMDIIRILMKEVLMSYQFTSEEVESCKNGISFFRPRMKAETKAQIIKSPRLT